MFIVGSVFFAPSLENLEPVGCWIFVMASILWLITSVHDGLELAYVHGGFIPKNIDGFAALNYVVGAILFILGSIFFLPTVGLWTGGSLCFIIGSALFITGGTLNGLQIFETQSKRDAQYMLMTAMSYVIGSTLFLVVSIPYLFTFDTTSDERKIDAFATGMYVTGSIFFSIGGVINFHRPRKGHEKQNNELRAA